MPPFKVLSWVNRMINSERNGAREIAQRSRMCVLHMREREGRREEREREKEKSPSPEGRLFIFIDGK